MSGRYEVTIRGRLTPALTSEFEQLDLTATPKAPETVIHGEVADPAALFGLLRRIESLGLELLDVHRVVGP